MHIDLVRDYLFSNIELWFNLSRVCKKYNSVFQSLLDNLSVDDLIDLALRCISSSRRENLRKFLGLEKFSSKLLNCSTCLLLLYKARAVDEKVSSFKGKFCSDIVLRFIRSHESIRKTFSEMEHQVVPHNIDEVASTAMFNYTSQIPFTNNYIINLIESKIIEVNDIIYFLSRVDDNPYILIEEIVLRFLMTMEDYPDYLKEFIRMYGARVRFYTYDNRLVSISRYYREQKNAKIMGMVMGRFR